MNPSQAKATVGLLIAAFPRYPLPESTVLLWAKALADTDFEDAKTAVEIAALSYDRMPSLHQVIALAEDVRRKRWEDDAMALPPESFSGEFCSFTDWLKTQPKEMRDRVRTLGSHWKAMVEKAEAGA